METLPKNLSLRKD